MPKRLDFTPGTYRVVNRGRRRRVRLGVAFPAAAGTGAVTAVDVAVRTPAEYLQIHACADLDVQRVTDDAAHPGDGDDDGVVADRGLDDLKVNELRAVAGQRQLATSGKRDELIARLAGDGVVAVGPLDDDTGEYDVVEAEPAGDDLGDDELV